MVMLFRKLAEGGREGRIYAYLIDMTGQGEKGERNCLANKEKIEKRRQRVLFRKPLFELNQ